MSFIRDYDIVTSGNESPRSYHSWAALSTLSSLVSRRVWVDQGIFTVYANMYILLVGSAGIKKSTAMSVSRRLIREVKTIPICPPSITKEALTQMMAEEDAPGKKTFKHVINDKPKLVEYNHLSLYANELVTLLNSGGNATGMVEFLTDVWDQDVFEVKTKNKGHDQIIGPYVTLLGCLTTETMSNLMNTKIISSGFSRRCVFVYSEDYGTPVPRPTVSPEKIAAWDRLVTRAKELQTVSGEFTWTEDAISWWDEWYVAHHQKKKNEENVILKGFYNSKAEYVLKIAMLTTLSESDSLILTPEHLALAVGFIDDIEPDMTLIFNGAGRNELSPVASSIEQLIVGSKEPVLLNRIYATFFKDATNEEIDKVISHLDKTKKIQRLQLLKDKRPYVIIARPDFDLASYQQAARLSPSKGSGSSASGSQSPVPSASLEETLKAARRGD